jgi:hypothetical protein
MRSAWAVCRVPKMRWAAKGPMVPSDPPGRAMLAGPERRSLFSVGGPCMGLASSGQTYLSKGIVPVTRSADHAMTESGQTSYVEATDE